MNRHIVIIGVFIPVVFLSGVSSLAARAGDEGQRLYRQYCASCHGPAGKGDGPAAPAMKTPPTDLTAIQKKGEAFPDVKVQIAIDGEKAIPSHGTRQMPIWGRAFRYTKGTPQKEAAIYGLVKYIESIQVNK